MRGFVKLAVRIRPFRDRLATLIRTGRRCEKITGTGHSKRAKRAANRPLRSCNSLASKIYADSKQPRLGIAKARLKNIPRFEGNEGTGPVCHSRGQSVLVYPKCRRAQVRQASPLVRVVFHRCWCGAAPDRYSPIFSSHHHLDS